MSVEDTLNNIEPSIGRLVFDGSVASAGEDEIDLFELWNAIWQGKWIIIGVIAVFLIASVILALYLPNTYQSTALLAPSEDAQGGGMSRMAGKLGGLASLAGITMGGSSGDDRVAVAMAVLKSRKFITDFVKKHEILPELMAAKAWDQESQELMFDSAIYDPLKKVWIRDLSSSKSKEPSDWEAYKAFKDILNVSQNKETGFVTLTVEHQSPVIAMQWVRLLVADVNQVMREKDVFEAQRSIEFLRNELDGVALADMRTVFYQLIEEQTKTIMLAKVRDEYVFKTLDPAVVAEEKTKPQRSLIVLLGGLLGGMCGLIWVFIRKIVNK